MTQLQLQESCSFNSYGKMIVRGFRRYRGVQSYFRSRDSEVGIATGYGLDD
jgi:hypothetical protein